MAGWFTTTRFSEIDPEDAFFDSLKESYTGSENSSEFNEWFQRKSAEGASALTISDELGIAAIIVLKDFEAEEIPLQDRVLPAIPRMKLSTLRVAERYRGFRIGEGAIGLILWKWIQSDVDEIYVTVFEKYAVLIDQFEKFGFSKAGINKNGEFVLIKNRRIIDFSDPYKSFPFIKNQFDHAGYIIIKDDYHDTMFAYSTLKNNKELKEKLTSSVSNGLSKVYIGTAWKNDFYPGKPVLVYRQYTKGNGARYRSCVTSFCIVSDAYQAKTNGTYLMDFDEFIRRIGNKTVFKESDLRKKFETEKNISVVEMIYYGFFGAGNNVTMDWLDNNGYWVSGNQYPTEIQLPAESFKKILTEGKVNVKNVIVD